MEPRDFHASHFAFLTKSSIPGFDVVHCPSEDWMGGRRLLGFCVDMDKIGWRRIELEEKTIH